MKVLPSLSQRELTQIRTHCQFLLQQSGYRDDPIETEDWLFHGIVTELKRRNLYVPVTLKQRSRSNGSYQTVSVEVRRLLELAVPDLDPIRRRALGQVAAKALADYLASFTKPPREISFQNMLLFASLTPTAIERAYPGYMEAQLLGLTIKGVG